MIPSQDIFDIAKSRFDEANILLKNGKPDGAVYLAGYAIELMLKRRIVHLLEWDGYPETNNEFERKMSFKTHNLDFLLHLSGLEKRIQAITQMYAKWQIARTWSEQRRYKAVGTIETAEAQDIIGATREVLNFIARETQP
jgi:hypothetical protein